MEWENSILNFLTLDFLSFFLFFFNFIFINNATIVSFISCVRKMLYLKIELRYTYNFSKKNSIFSNSVPTLHPAIKQQRVGKTFPTTPTVFFVNFVCDNLWAPRSCESVVLSSGVPIAAFSSGLKSVKKVPIPKYITRVYTFVFSWIIPSLI